MRVAVASTLLALPLAMAPFFTAADACPKHEKDTRFYVPKPNQGAIDQIATLKASGHRADAKLIKDMALSPAATPACCSMPPSSG
jgi:hypothetical protein